MVKSTLLHFGLIPATLFNLESSTNAMTLNFAKAWINLRSSLWFIPAICVVCSAGLAVGMVELDFMFSQREQHEWPRFFSANPEGSRGILGAIATSTITVAGVIFSMVTVALSIASNQYTPRILRTFMRDKGTQSVLGVFVGVFTYSLIVLRTIRSGENPFVPAIATNLAILLALVSIGFLVYFIHHIASSIQAPTMIAAIAAETIDAVERMFPEKAREPETPDIPDGTDWIVLPSVESGYIQAVGQDLVGLAAKHNLVIRVERRIGEFVVKGAPLLAVQSRDQLSEELRRTLLCCVVLDSFRTVDQDPSYGIQQLVDIAIKALSPGVNDTSTAINCIDYLGAILASLLRREPMQQIMRCEGEVRLIYATCLDVEHLTDSAFVQIRQNARGNPGVMLRLLKMIETSADVAKHSSYKAILGKHLSLIEEIASESIKSLHDRGIVLMRAQSLRASVLIT